MSLRRMRWMSDEDGRWELDAETPVTMEGTVRPVPGDPLPLGLSRGYRVTRPKQLDFFHRFMASPLVPTFSATRDDLSVNHAHMLYITDNWYGDEPYPLHTCTAPRMLRLGGTQCFACNLVASGANDNVGLVCVV